MAKHKRIYLDHAATTPMVPAARAALIEGLERCANPSSPHSEGRAARAALEDARRRISGILGWDGEVIFTSGASEAINLALKDQGAVAVSDVEHDAVLSVSPENPRLRVDAGGMIQLLDIAGARRYAVQMVNNETGVIQPVAALFKKVNEEGGIWFADCSQSAGKIPLPDADIICISAHKLGGPPGIGALLTRNLGLLKPTGGQEQGYRRGTENLPAVLAFAAALEAGYDWMQTAQQFRAALDSAIIQAGGAVVAEKSPRIATIAAYHMPGVSASSQLIGFDMEGIAVSAGSACSSGTLKSSHVLSAMGWKVQEANEVIRVSFGPETNAVDIGRFVAVWQRIAQRAQAA
jgi:cysteine desulfurase